MASRKQTHTGIGAHGRPGSGIPGSSGRPAQPYGRSSSGGLGSRPRPADRMNAGMGAGANGPGFGGPGTSPNFGGPGTGPGFGAGPGFGGGTPGGNRGGMGAGGPQRYSGGSGLNKVAMRIPSKRGEVVLTRRHLLFGAAGLAVVIGAGAGVSAISKKLKGGQEITVLSVPESAVTPMANYSEAEFDEYLYLAAEFELPFGTLVWANGSIAACLIPGETGNPLTQIGVLFLSTGYCPVVLERAVGADEGFDIYDVRGSEIGFIWTEVNILQGIWRVYCAPLVDTALGTPTLLDTGDSEWETPTLATVGSSVYWQVLPSLSGSHTSEQSLLKKASIASPTPHTVYYSTGRMATPPYAASEGVVITPRADTSGVYYQLTLLKESDDSIIDTMVLPQSMKPLEAGYGKNGFNFSFDAIYNYGDGIANLGTYTPLSKPTAGAYSDARWFTLSRTPSAPPCWCGNLFMVKSTRMVCGVDMDNGMYFVIDTHGGSDNWGDYLASTGTTDLVVTYANVDDKPIEGDALHCTLVRVFARY